VRRAGWSEARLVTWLIVAFLVWVPLQTPVAVLIWEYLHAPDRVAQGILLIKDVWAAAFILVLFARHWREIRFHWYDWCALAYGILIAVYSVVPSLRGSNLTLVAIIASARELLVPIELYALGRLGGYAGVSTAFVVKAFLAIAAVAAVFSVGTWAVMPQTFWSSTYNLVGFIHDVQGVTTATTTWFASILANYGPYGWSVRAVGPFAHPVGAGVYFAMPMALVLCAAWLSGVRRRFALAVVLAGVVLFAAAVISPISRGTWIGLVVAAIVAGAVLHKYRLAALTVVVFVLFVGLVPPYSYAIRSAVTGTDSSTVGHQDAVQLGIKTVAQNPVGVGVGQGDQFGAILSGGDSLGIGENMYLTTYASVGPLGLLAFAAVLLGMLWELIARLRPNLPPWIPIGVGVGLLAEIAAGFTASTLMRFTTAASIFVLIGLVMGEPGAGIRPDFEALLHPRKWLTSRGRKPAAEVEAADPSVSA
jgi:hypothetical protein